jgi:Pvc16 N-terminal domain
VAVVTAHFAIPATTFVLRAVLQRRIALAYGTFTAPTVSVEPPPRPASTPSNGPPVAQAEPAGLYLFLHHVAVNPAWRNMHEPHMDSGGQRQGPSPLALDLHYLLAATGADLEREVLLGLGVTALNRHGIVPRALIQSILGSITVPGPPTALLDTLTKEPLHDPARQPEQITVSQAAVDIDLSTKVWSALQSPMRPCAHFLVTTVFLDVGDTYPAGPDVDAVQVGVRPDPTPATTLPEGDTLTVEEVLHG